jgi:hypothetical protein
VRILLAVLIALAAATAAPAAVEVRCGDVHSDSVQPPQDVRALGVSCRKAKRLARRHDASSGRYDHCSLAKPSCTLDGWKCRRTFFGNSGTRVRCTMDQKRVRFFYGS